jgi:hypothetical protein
MPRAKAIAISSEKERASRMKITEASRKTWRGLVAPNPEVGNSGSNAKVMYVATLWA